LPVFHEEHIHGGPVVFLTVALLLGLFCAKKMSMLLPKMIACGDCVNIVEQKLNS
jgi:hypothetical protein